MKKKVQTYATVSMPVYSKEVFRRVYVEVLLLACEKEVSAQITKI